MTHYLSSLYVPFSSNQPTYPIHLPTYSPSHLSITYPPFLPLTSLPHIYPPTYPPIHPPTYHPLTPSGRMGERIVGIDCFVSRESQRKRPHQGQCQETICAGDQTGGVMLLMWLLLLFSNLDLLSKTITIYVRFYLD